MNGSMIIVNERKILSLSLLLGTPFLLHTWSPAMFDSGILECLESCFYKEECQPDDGWYRNCSLWIHVTRSLQSIWKLLTHLKWTEEMCSYNWIFPFKYFWIFAWELLWASLIGDLLKNHSALSLYYLVVLLSYRKKIFHENHTGKHMDRQGDSIFI